MKKLLKQFAPLLSVAALWSPLSHAVDLDAGDYDTAPAGTSVALLYLQHATRDELYNGSDEVPGNPRLDSNIGIARFVHYTELANHLVLPQILIPFGQLKAKEDTAALGKASGLGDIVVAAPYWLINNTEQKTYWGVTPYLFLPTGDYSQNKVLNIGENRYKLNLQTAFSTRLTPQLAWDVAGDVTFYGNNSDAVGGGTLKQDAGYQIQSNGRYFLNDQWDLRAGISYADAGDTEQNGLSADSVQQSKFWLGTAFVPSPTTQVILTYGRDISVENAFKENNRINVRLLKAF